MTFSKQCEECLFENFLVALKGVYFMIHICFGLFRDTKYAAKFVGTAILSIFENLSVVAPSITVHILHDNTLTDDNRKKFFSLADHYKQFVKFYNLEELKNNPAIFSKISFDIMRFHHLCLPQIIPSDVEKIIYLKAKSIVNLDIKELWQTDMGDKPLGAVPEILNGISAQTSLALCRSGHVKPEDYFNAGVLLLNLKILRGEKETLVNGLKLLGNKYGHGAQDILNYCFAGRALALPVKFNQCVRSSRKNKKNAIEKKIYLYIGSALQLDFEDPFNYLWIGYFVKTSWFNVDTIGRLYVSLQKIRNDLKDSGLKIAKITRGRTRTFFVEPKKIKVMKKFFFVRDDEEIIPADNEDSIQKLVDNMKENKDKYIFFIMTENFSFDQLIKEGFVQDEDFVNGLEYFSGTYIKRMNSYPLVQVM